MLEKESKKIGYDWRELAKGERLAEVGKKFNIQTEEDLMAALGYGGVTTHGIMTKLIEAYKKEVGSTKEASDVSKLLAKLKPHNNTNKSGHGILVEGESGLMVRLAKCCNPLPGDPIIGYITRGRGVSVHRADCTNILVQPEEYERMIEVSWDLTAGNLYKVIIEVTGVDRSELLSDILLVTSESKIKVSSVNAKVLKSNIGSITLTLNISNLNQLEHIMTKMRRVRDVYSVHRAMPNLGGVG
jgi:GTP pyrophosphokinase